MEAANHTKSIQLNPPITELITIKSSTNIKQIYHDLYFQHRPDNKLRFATPLKDYHIPFQLRLGLNQGKPGEELSNLLELEVGPQLREYSQKFASLLYIEELQMEVDIRHYDMEDVFLNPSTQGGFLVLKVVIYRFSQA